MPNLHGAAEPGCHADADDGRAPCLQRRWGILQRVAAERCSVRRFAAIDMYGASGTRRRRQIVMAEFVPGTAGLLALAVRLVAHSGWLWATWALGCAVNYGALAVHAVALYPQGRLEAALEGVDVRSEIRRYSIAQLLLFVPALIAGIAASQALHRDRDPND